LGNSQSTTGRSHMDLPKHQPPEATTRVVCTYGPEWMWLSVTLALAGVLGYHQLLHFGEARMPLPLLSWIHVPTWVGWILHLPVLCFAAVFSCRTIVTVDPMSEFVTSETLLLCCLPIRRSQRALRDIAAIRCSHEGLKTGKVAGGPIVAVYKAMVMVLVLALLTSPTIAYGSGLLADRYPVVEALFWMSVFVCSIILEWGTPTVRLLFIDGRSWILTRGADDEIYRVARLVARLAGVRVIS
jgi:hypothetical protein